MNIKFYIIALLFSIYFVAPAHADSSKEVIKLVDDYLASIKTIKSEFVQTDSSGGKRGGMMYVKKPNRIRIEYSSPDRELVLLKSDLIMHYLEDLDEANYLPKDELAISLLAQKNFKLTKQAKINKFELVSNFIELGFFLRDDRQNRYITLRIQKNPMKLISIAVNNGDDLVTVNFIAPIVNDNIDNKVFEFSNKSIHQ
ncbi:MAG: outer rane lipoprotein carrier protein LolA [Candidatus Midichloriaceae bacterium]|jgi:outer membrane lipoprotein-sorting protein|nr:outer rane lipoprotein carrier protein LolA [Candidatus Midichloriaceae bacterium]